MYKNAYLFLALMVLAAGAAAQDTVKIEVRSVPDSPPSEVWIDGKHMEKTPLYIPYFSAGIHTVRVIRPGGALEARVLLKGESEVMLVADFLRNTLTAGNGDDLEYDPIRGETAIILTSTSWAPAPPPPPPMEGEVTAVPVEPEVDEAAPPTDESNTDGLSVEDVPGEEPIDEIPVPETGPEEQDPTERAVPETEETRPEESPVETVVTGLTGTPETAESIEEPEQPAPQPEEQPLAEPEPTPEPEEPWLPDPEVQPQQGNMGPPVPDGIRAAVEEKRERERLEILRAAEERRTAIADEMASLPEPPCSPNEGSEQCMTEYGSGIRATVYGYYCSLAKNDFKQAYFLWKTDRDAQWFYDVSKSFCNISDFAIRGFEVQQSDEYDAMAVYIVDLISDSGTESWKMRAGLAQTESGWKMVSVAGESP